MEENEDNKTIDEIKTRFWKLSDKAKVEILVRALFGKRQRNDERSRWCEIAEAMGYVIRGNLWYPVSIEQLKEESADEVSKAD